MLLYGLWYGVFTHPSGLFLIISLISMKRQSSSFFVLFWDYFLLKPCKMGDFGCLEG